LPNEVHPGFDSSYAELLRDPGSAPTDPLYPHRLHQLKGVEEASLELLQESAQSCLLGFGISVGLLVLLDLPDDYHDRTWLELQKPEPWLQPIP
jgi:hypothetical protein